MNELLQIVKQGRTMKYDWPPLARLGKVMEETGEFAETIMHIQGFLPHKSPKETPIGEAADVLICTIDTLASVYPELSPEHIIEELLKSIKHKSKKWKEVIIDPRNTEYENSNSGV